MANQTTVEKRLTTLPYSVILSTHLNQLEQNMMIDTLIPNANWQTQQRGDNDSEYQIYVAAAESLGWEVKSYDEWLNS